MHRAWVVVAFAVVACKSKAEETPPKPEPAKVEPAKPAPPAAPTLSLAKGPPPELAPAPSTSLPPPAAGFYRLPYYDLDIKIPDAAHATSSGPRGVSFGMCSIYLRTEQLKDPKKVGTLLVSCEGSKPECTAPCDTLVAVKGGTALEPYPSEPPVLDLGSFGGVAGMDYGGALVWADGTVQYHGPKCKQWRGRRGKLSAERVTAIVDALEKGGVFTYNKPEAPGCPDSIASWLVVNAHGKQARLGSGGCSGQDTTDLPNAAMGLVHGALAPNPCQE